MKPACETMMAHARHILLAADHTNNTPPLPPWKLATWRRQRSLPMNCPALRYITISKFSKVSCRSRTGDEQQAG